MVRSHASTESFYLFVFVQYDNLNINYINNTYLDFVNVRADCSIEHDNVQETSQSISAFISSANMNSIIETITTDNPCYQSANQTNIVNQQKSSSPDLENLGKQNISSLFLYQTTRYLFQKLV